VSSQSQKSTLSKRCGKNGEWLLSQSVQSKHLTKGSIFKKGIKTKSGIQQNLSQHQRSAALSIFNSPVPVASLVNPQSPPPPQSVPAELL